MDLHTSTEESRINDLTLIFVWADVCHPIPAQRCNGLLSYALEISTEGRGNMIWQCYFSTRVNGCSCSPLCLCAANPLTCVIAMSLILVPCLAFDLTNLSSSQLLSHLFPTCVLPLFHPSHLACLLFSVVPGEEILDLILYQHLPHLIKKQTIFIRLLLLGNCIFLIRLIWKWENVSVIVLLHIPINEPVLSLTRCNWPDTQTGILGCQIEQQQPSTQNSYRNDAEKPSCRVTTAVSSAWQWNDFTLFKLHVWDIMVGWWDPGKPWKTAFWGDLFSQNQPTHHSVTARDAYKPFKNFASSRQKDNITASCFYDSDFYPEGELKLFQMSQQFPFLSLSFSLIPSVSPALSVSPSRSASLTASPTVLITTSAKYPAENTSSLIRDWSIFSIRRHCFLGNAGLPNENHYRVSDWFTDPVSTTLDFSL